MILPELLNDELDKTVEEMRRLHMHKLMVGNAIECENDLIIAFQNFCDPSALVLRRKIISLRFPVLAHSRHKCLCFVAG